MQRCDVCGKEGKVYVVNSATGAVSFAYCAECFQSYREPYSAVVASLYGMNSMEEVAEWYKPVIYATLEAEGKTVEQLFEDVEAFAQEYELAMRHGD